MTIRTALAATLLVSIASAGVAFAHPEHDEYEGVKKPAMIVPVAPATTPSPAPAPLPKIRFAEFDKNNDRQISKSEWRGKGRSFRKLDKNNDGVLSGAEVTVAATAKQ